MGKILAVTNQKGGVGKTTSCINLSAALVATKHRVLLVDMDPQGNATTGSGVDKQRLELSSYHMLTGRCSIKDIIHTTEHAGYDIVPTNADLTAAEVELVTMSGKETKLRDALLTIQDRYDYIVIDCPPSLNMLTLNALAAAEGVLIPMQCEYYALEGLTALMETVTGIRQTINPKLHIEGLLRTMYDPRIGLTNEVSRQLITHFGDQVYRTVIPRNVRLAEAPSHGMSVLSYDRRSRGAIAYLALAGEVVRRHDTKVKGSGQNKKERTQKETGIV